MVHMGLIPTPFWFLWFSRQPEHSPYLLRSQGWALHILAFLCSIVWGKKPAWACRTGHRHTHIYMYMHTHTHIRAHTYIQYKHIRTHTHMHTCAQTLRAICFQCKDKNNKEGNTAHSSAAANQNKVYGNDSAIFEPQWASAFKHSLCCVSCPQLWTTLDHSGLAQVRDFTYLCKPYPQTLLQTISCVTTQKERAKVPFFPNNSMITVSLHNDRVWQAHTDITKKWVHETCIPHICASKYEKHQDMNRGHRYKTRQLLLYTSVWSHW